MEQELRLVSPEESNSRGGESVFLFFDGESPASPSNQSIYLPYLLPYIRITGGRPSDQLPCGRGRRSYAYLLRKLHFSLSRGPRVPLEVVFCSYLLRLLHVGARRNFFRMEGVCDLVRICYGCGTCSCGTSPMDFCGHSILCIFTTHSALSLRPSLS